MKNQISVTIVMLSAWLMFSSCGRPPVADAVTAEDMKTLIDNANQKIESFYKAQLIDSLALYFADNCIQMPPNNPPTVGLNAFKAAWQESFQYGDWIFNLETQEVKLSGPLVVERGTYTLDFTADDSSPIPSFSDRGNYVVLWENIDGKWKIVWDAPVSEVPLSDQDI
jgi:ketosteroid isomerase-like protein